MPDFISDEELRAVWDEAQRASKLRGITYGLLGSARRSSDPFSVAGRPAYVMWVRILEGDVISGERAVVNKKTQRRYDLAVQMELNADGDLEVVDTWTQRAAERYGALLPSVSTPEVMAEANRILLPAANFVPGRPRVVSGLTITLEPFWYDDENGDPARWNGQSSGTVTLVAPSASGGVNTVRWTVLSFNKSTPAIELTNGTATSVAQPEPTKASIASIAIPDGNIPIWAFRMRTGGSIVPLLVEADSEDLRRHFGENTTGGFDADRILVNSYGDVLTNGTNVLTS